MIATSGQGFGIILVGGEPYVARTFAEKKAQKPLLVETRSKPD